MSKIERDIGAHGKLDAQTAEFRGGGGNLNLSREAETGMEGYNFEGQRVLLIEDNDLNREIVQELLEATGMKVDTAENGKMAVERFMDSEADYYKVILMDIDMPVMNGYEASKAIRASSHPRAGTIPILAMTGSIFAVDREHTMESGMNEHIEKPIDTVRLFKVIQSYLEKKN